MNSIVLYSIISYIIGSISGSLLLGKIWKIDIRKFGSNNAGGTNAFRTVGLLFGLLTIIIDISKGALPTYLSGYLDNQNQITMIVCAFSAVLGHVYPIFHQFKGGKGAGTVVGALLVLIPKSLIFILPGFIITLILTGFVGLSTMVAAFILLIYSLIMLEIHFIYFTLMVFIFIVFTHRKNIKRMLAGNENCFSKIMIFKRK
tara:strand:- start:27 stop:632 length:606 start_codon:yes stop_codon:yes gene_type:complete